MIVGIVGSRRRNSMTDKELIKQELLKILEEYSVVKICSGGCSRGGDYFAEELSKEFKLEITIYKANWDKYGKKLGIPSMGSAYPDSYLFPDNAGGMKSIHRFFEPQKELNIANYPYFYDKEIGNGVPFFTDFMIAYVGFFGSGFLDGGTITYWTW